MVVAAGVVAVLTIVSGSRQEAGVVADHRRGLLRSACDRGTPRYRDRRLPASTGPALAGVDGRRRARRGHRRRARAVGPRRPARRRSRRIAGSACCWSCRSGSPGSWVAGRRPSSPRAPADRRSASADSSPAAVEEQALVMTWSDPAKVDEYVGRVGRLAPRLAGEAALVELLPDCSCAARPRVWRRPAHRTRRSTPDRVWWKRSRSTRRRRCSTSRVRFVDEPRVAWSRRPRRSDHGAR